MTEATAKPTPIVLWIRAARPRTLPLALAGVVLGSLLAAADNTFNGLTALLCLITATLLQILSNLANDYGDYVHGADHAGRQGPRRAVASGDITPRAMRIGIAVVTLAALITGLLLIGVAASDHPAALIVFIILGGGAVLAALTYTLGARPYGYAGLGDLSVLIFFGWAGVLGTYYLQAGELAPALILPATSVGALTVGVLNLNNLRDRESDLRAGKRTLPARIGDRRARLYHTALIGGAVALSLIYVGLDYRGAAQFLFLLMTPLLARHVVQVWRAATPRDLIPPLKQLALLTLGFALLLGVGQWLA
jgi:1,4-dihydroxy-2-naphthoate octaprenyltransferase